jgi:hypothetical protein
MRFCLFFSLACAISLSLPLTAQVDSGSKSVTTHNSIGFVASDDADAKDVGLPVYPGARPYKDKDEDATSANLGLWGGAFGFKLAVMKLESGDTPEKIAVFYRKALSRYGNVLDCTSNSSREKKRSGSFQELDCNHDKPDPGGMLFKSGAKSDQHLVEIEPHGGGARFQLVYVMEHGSDSK